MGEHEAETMALLRLCLCDGLGARAAIVCSRTSGLPASIVSSVLLTLEIRGLARQLPGQRYARP